MTRFHERNKDDEVPKAEIQILLPEYFNRMIGKNSNW